MKKVEKGKMLKKLLLVSSFALGLILNGADSILPVYFKQDPGIVVDGNLITSRGPGTTLPFAYRLVEMLGGDADKLRSAMQYNALKESWKHRQ